MRGILVQTERLVEVTWRRRSATAVWAATTALVALLAAAPGAPRAELLLGDWLALYAADRESADRLLGAVGDSLLWANAVLGIEDKPRLFCLPPKVELGLADYRRLVEEAARSQGPENSARIDVPILLLRGLREAFPCGKSGHPVRQGSRVEPVVFA